MHGPPNRSWCQLRLLQAPDVHHACSQLATASHRAPPRHLTSTRGTSLLPSPPISPPAPPLQGFDALLAKANATWDDMLSASMNDTLAAIVGLHVVPGPQPLFPLSDVRDGQPLATATGRDIYLRRE